MQIRFVTVDVFTDRKFGGNQLAVVPQAAALTSEQMQSIAAEFNFAETTFVLPPQDASHTAEVRIFTPRSELPFAGHPNIGTAYVLATDSEGYPRALPDPILFEEKAGLVRLSLMRQGASVVGARLALVGLLASLRPAPDLKLHLRIAQGVDMGRPSLLEASAEKKNGKLVGLLIGGRCVPMMRGTLEV